MTMMTNAELLKVIRKPGKIVMPVLGRDDVVHITVEKADLVAALNEMMPDDPALWNVSKTQKGYTFLDVQDREIV